MRLVVLALIAATPLVSCSAVLSLDSYEAPLNLHYQRTEDPREIVVTAVLGQGDEVIGSSAREDPTTVAVTVRARNPNPAGWRNLAGYPQEVSVRLRAPLGDRRVIDAQTGQRIQDLAVSIARREAGLIDKDSYETANGAVDFRWTDSKGTHALSDLRGSTVVLVTRGRSYEQQSESKMNMLALASYLSQAPDVERAKTFVFVINFDRVDAVAPDDDPFRPLLADPNGLRADAPEIFQPSAPSLVWILGPDGRLRERIVGATSEEQVARSLAAVR